MLESNRGTGIAVDDPTTHEERTACALRVATAIPTLVDGLDNEVARVYGAWPDRLYLIGADARIAYQGGEGPSGFEPEELEDAIEREFSATLEA